MRRDVGWNHQDRGELQCIVYRRTKIEVTTVNGVKGAAEDSNAPDHR